MMEPSWPNLPSLPFIVPPPREPWRFRIFKTYRLSPSLFSGMSSLVPPRKEGKREPYLSYARNLFLQLPHARRYVNAPSAPTTAPVRPGGLEAWHSSVPGDRETRGGREAPGPAEAREGKGNCNAVAQHKMRQQSKGQTARNRLAKEKASRNAQSWASAALTIEGEAAGKKTPVRHGSEGERKAYVEHRPLRRTGEIYGRAGTVGREPGVGEPPRARAPAGPKRWFLMEPRASCSGARGGWWQEQRGQATGKLLGHARGFRAVEGGEDGLGNAWGSGTPVPGCEHPRRLAGPAEGVRELRRSAAAPGGAGRGKEH